MISKIKSAIKSINPRSPKFIIAAVLIISIPLLVLIAASSQKQSSIQPQWESYEEQVRKGEIKPAGKILEVVLDYNNTASPSALTIKEINRKNGYVPGVIEEDHQYRIELLNSSGNVLSTQFFSIQTKIRAETLDKDGKIHGSDIELTEGSLVVSLPWNDSGASIRVVEKNGRQVVSSGLSSMRVVNNKPNFKSINGDEILESSDKKINFNFFANEIFAQTNNEKLDIVFIGDNYTDMGQFHGDVDRFANTLLEYEPFKPRASQIAFHYVDNEADLECGSVNGTRLAGCNNQLVKQKVNDAGVPYDKIAVIINTTEWIGFGGDISISYNGPDGEHMFVHEFGHSFGKLIDEYAYDGEAKEGIIDNNTYRYSDDFSLLVAGEGNCLAGDPPASEWDSNTVKPEDYRQRCGRLNWYASSQESVMSDLVKSRYFNSISQGIIGKRLDGFVNQPEPEPKVITVSGRVTDASGNGVGGVKVSTCTFGDVTTDSNGNWQVTGVSKAAPFCARAGNDCQYKATNSRTDSCNYEFQMAGISCGQGETCGPNEDANDRNSDSGYDFIASKGNAKKDAPTGTYTNWYWPDVANGYNSLEWDLTVLKDPTPAGYYWSNYFSFGNGSGAYGGLQSNGIRRSDGSKGKMAIFSIWDTTESDGPACGKFAGEGEGQSCSIAYEWVTNRVYKQKVSKVSSDSSGTWWGSWIIDTTNQKEDFIGKIKVPAGWGALNPSSIMFSENFAPPINSCDELVHSSVVFGYPKVNGSVVPQSHKNHLADPISCPGSYIADVSNGVQHDMGSKSTPTSAPTITPQPTSKSKPTSTSTPTQPAPTWVCGGSKESICTTPTTSPHPTKSPIVTNQPAPTISGEPILNPTPVPDDPCLNPQDPGFRQKLTDWVNSIKEQVNRFIQGILGNPTAPRTERPKIKPPCINR